MKDLLRKLFKPILDNFESGSGQYNYKPSHRRILIIVGALFLMLAASAVFFSLVAGELAGLLPALVFFSVGAVCEVVGLLGTDKAVATLWKSR